MTDRLADVISHLIIITCEVTVEINVVNKYKHTPEPCDVYIGRGTPLGNPYPISSKNSRDVVCDKYKEHIKELSEGMAKQLNDIVSIGKKYGKVNLVCFCKPCRCHGDSIKKIIEDKLK